MGDIGEQQPGIVEIIPPVSPTAPHEPPARRRGRQPGPDGEPVPATVLPVPGALE